MVRAALLASLLLPPTLAHRCLLLPGVHPVTHDVIQPPSRACATGASLALPGGAPTREATLEVLDPDLIEIVEHVAIDVHLSDPGDYSRPQFCRRLTPARAGKSLL